MAERSLASLDPLGGARVVDVSPREPTHRRALARCRVTMLPETTAKVASNAITKGDVLGAARIAGIQAAKRTADLIPMCHPVLVESVSVNFSIGDDWVEVEAQVETIGRTGVEMEAMTACSIAALTDAGRRVLEEAAPGHVESVRRHLFDQLSDREASELRDVCEKLVRYLLRSLNVSAPSVLPNDYFGVQPGDSLNDARSLP